MKLRAFGCVGVCVKQEMGPIFAPGFKVVKLRDLRQGDEYLRGKGCIVDGEY